jgi:hypothetical protein
MSGRRFCGSLVRVELASRKRPKGGQMSLRAVAAEMAVQGFLNERGAPFNRKSIASMRAA